MSVFADYQAVTDVLGHFPKHFLIFIQGFKSTFLTINITGRNQDINVAFRVGDLLGSSFNPE